LEQRGARILPFPVLAIAPPADPAPLDEACGRIDTFDWLLLTSANGVAAVAERVPAWPDGGPRIAVVGKQTAKAVERLGWTVDALPARANAEGLLAELGARGELAGRRFLFPRAETGREVLVDGIRGAGGEVELVVAYRAVTVDHPAEAVRATFADTRVDLVTFTSGACAENFLAILESAGLADVARTWPTAVIGPVTAEACDALGMRVVATAAEPNPAALLAAASAYLWPPTGTEKR
jgi:uroporphyrinogen-III synthase